MISASALVMLFRSMVCRVVSGQQNHSMELHLYIQHSQSQALNDNILTVEHTAARLEQPKPVETLFLW